MKRLHKLFDIKKFPMDLGRISYFVYGAFTAIKKVKPEGFKFPENGAVIVANHTSFSDPHTVGATFPMRRVFFMSSKEVMGKGLRNICMRGMGCIPVDREIFDINCIKRCVDLLKNGYVVTVFPQGTIKKEEKINSLKAGAVLLACKANVPVVPMYICKKQKGLFKRKHVVVGSPVDFKNIIGDKKPTSNDIENFTLLLQEEIVKCEDKAKELWGAD